MEKKGGEGGGVALICIGIKKKEKLAEGGKPRDHDYYKKKNCKHCVPLN